MRPGKVIVIAFSAMLLIQLSVPSSMIMQRERVLTDGAVLHFRTEPVDPTDLFRGKYIVLTYPDRSWSTIHQVPFTNGDRVYATFRTDEGGFAVIDSILRERPEFTNNYLETTVDYSYTQEKTVEVFLNYPFERFYMEESKALTAETLYRESQLDSTMNTYAIVKVWRGSAVLENVMLGDRAIRDAVIEELDGSP